MPVTKSAKKALRGSLKKQAFNTAVRSRMRSAIKSFMTAAASESLSEAYSRIDRAVKNNLLHRNTAARRKARLARTLKVQAQAKAK